MEQHFNTEDQDPKELESIKRLEAEHTKMFHDTFKTPAGKRCLEYLRKTYIETVITRDQDTPVKTYKRGGKAELILGIIREVERTV